MLSANSAAAATALTATALPPSQQQVGFSPKCPPSPALGAAALNPFVGRRPARGQYRPGVVVGARHRHLELPVADLVGLAVPEDHHAAGKRNRRPSWR